MGTVDIGTAFLTALVAVTMSTDTVAAGYRWIEWGITAVTGIIFVGVGARLAAER